MEGAKGGGSVVFERNVHHILTHLNNPFLGNGEKVRGVLDLSSEWGPHPRCPPGQALGI